MFRGVCAALALAWPGLAGEPRDIVFDCPCRAEWTAGPGDGGELTLEFGVRSHRATESGEVRLDAQSKSEPEPATSLGRVGGGIRRSGERRVLRSETPTSGGAIVVRLLENIGSREPRAGPESEWRARDAITLWSTTVAADGRVEFVDILTDTDGDGVGDVNEVLAGTSPTNEASLPMEPSTIDVLAVYSAGFRAHYGGYPETRIHHVMTVTGALFADSGTNIRLRTVGMSEVALDEGGRPVWADRQDLRERHGADLSLMFQGCEVSDVCRRSGWASVGGGHFGGYWDGDRLQATVVWSAGALTAAHELGHNLGLVHSDRQGETGGSFRWSRGHYVDAEFGTIMSYGAEVLGGVFSDPRADCQGVPCGVSADEPAGADAVRSMDVLRWQAAAHNAAKPDSDGDGIVDPGDALPDDPAEYIDSDGDGVGNNADADDDNDGVADGEDAFPVDPAEWADADGDGIGDNADESVANLDPFRDPALRAAVEAALDKAPGDPIGESDLLTLTMLEAPWGAGIRDLSGLELAANLEVLRLGGNEVEQLSPLARLSGLRDLELSWNRVSDLSPLANVSALRNLWLDRNAISDLNPLANVSALRKLSLDRNAISDLAPLADLAALEALDVHGNLLYDLTPVAGMAALRRLIVSSNALSDLSPLTDSIELRVLVASDNPITDVSPLRRLDNLAWLWMDGTNVDDLSPLSGLNLRQLDVGRTAVTFDDVVALPNSRRLLGLGIARLGVSDEALGPLSEFDRLTALDLAHNRIADLSPLTALRGLWNLDLRGNLISDIDPLARREIWDLESGSPYLDARLNPLDRASLREHIPELEAWGVSVYAPALPSGILFPDPVLGWLVRRAVAGQRIHVDSPITEESLARLWRLDAFNAGVADLAGLEAAAELRLVFLGSNDVSDLSPLGDLGELAGLDLSDNRISDISRLVANPALGEGDWVTLDGNPLSEESLNVHVPALLERGVAVSVERIELALAAGGGPARYDTAGYFEALLGADATLSASSDDASLATADTVGGVLVVTPGMHGGTVTVRVDAAGADGARATLSFAVIVRGARLVPLFPSATDALGRQGFVRVVNRGPVGEVEVLAVDDGGWRAPALTLEIGAGETVHFNSTDLENGNTAKGLTGASGRGTGDWRLEIGSALDLDVLAYIRTPDGFLTAMHDTAPRTETGDHLVPIFNPASNMDQASSLRLVNLGETAVQATISGTDDRGESPGGDVRVDVPGRASLTLTARDLESGTGAGQGALGDGVGKWRLRIAADGDLAVMSLLASPEGHLTNLSTAAPAALAGDGAHTVPLFPSASDAFGRQGFVRVVNRSGRRGEIRIEAFDDRGQAYDPLTLALDAGRVAHFNSDDLEIGNAAKGLEGSTGAGTGDWRLELSGDLGVEVLAYVRTPSGFLTSMHDVVSAAGRRHDAATFNPGSNTNQVSRLRIVNPGSVPAHVSLAGVDDAGRVAEEVVRIEVPAGAARTLTAAALERGEGLRERLGDGTGKWRLTVDSEQPVLVMSLLSSPTGHMTNLSTRPNR